MPNLASHCNGITSAEKPERYSDVKALMLGYSARKSRVSSILNHNGFHVVESSEPVRNLKGYDLTVSFGYRHMISKSALLSANGPVLNLHLSYLPFNRGAHPVFWACLNREPTGVTIHQIDERLDTGPIFARRKVNIAQTKVTFRQAHALLKISVEDLFGVALPGILDLTIVPQPQEYVLPSKTKKDLPREFRGWDSLIEPEVIRLRAIYPPK